MLVVDAGIHGDEHEGVIALLELLRDMDPATLTGTLIGVPVLNGPAFEAGTRGNPSELHVYDMNRAFPGEQTGTITKRIAARYFEDVVKLATVHVSLHGGGGVFYHAGAVNVPILAPEILRVVKSIGWQRYTDAPDSALSPLTGTLSQHCWDNGIPSVMMELGGASHRAPAQLTHVRDEFHRGLRNLMIACGLIEGHSRRSNPIHRIKKYNVKTNAGGVVVTRDWLDIEAEVEKGEVLCDILDYLGNLLEEVRSPLEGRVMGLPGSCLAYPGRIVASIYSVLDETHVD
ncbi:MAG: M14 family metallopeptidase [bacterium]|nr:M14 family metallopeptidase [bacterium]